MSRRPVTGEALYRWALRAFPPAFRRRYGGEMLETFRCLQEEGRRRGRTAAGGRLDALALSWRAVGAGARERWEDRREAHRAMARPGSGWNGGGTPPLGKGGDLMDAVGRNLAYAVRALRRTPTFTFTAILLMGTGVGAVTTIFTVVDHVLLRPLPYPEAPRLVTVDNGSHSVPFLADVRTSVPSFERVEAAFRTEQNLTGEGPPAALRVARVTPGFLELMGARPLRGRLLGPQDEVEGAPSVLLSRAAWERIRGADPDIVGRTLVLDGATVRVEGVLDDRFHPPEALTGPAVDVWRPMDPAAEYSRSDARFFRVLQIVARLAPGATLESANQELDRLGERLAEAFPEAYRRRDGTRSTFPAISLQEATVRASRPALTALLAGVSVLLLVACANTAGLFLARGITRQRELAVRRSLGAGPGSIAGTLLAESLLVALAAGAVGVWIASVATPLFVGAIPATLPGADGISLDLRVLAAALALAGATGVVFGLVPLLRVTRVDLGALLHGGGREGRTRGSRLLRNGLVVAEVALSILLVVQAGLLARSFLNLERMEPGLDGAGVVTVPLRFPAEAGPLEARDPHAYIARMEAIREAVAAVPGVLHAAVGLTAPLQYTGGGRCCWSTTVQAPTLVPGGGGEPGRAADPEPGPGGAGPAGGSAGALPEARASLHPVSPDYLDLLRIPLLAGRVPAVGEGREGVVPVVAAAALARALGTAPAELVGAELTSSGQRYLVVGVAGDVHHYGVDQPPDPALYLPFEAVPFPFPMAHVLVRTGSDDPEALAPSLRAAIGSVAPELPLPEIRTMEGRLNGSLSRQRFDSLLFLVLSGMALLLSAGGLYGTLLHRVAEERREMAIRLTLGAAPSGVALRVVTRGLALTGVGCFLGLLGTAGTSRLMEARLFGVGKNDPATLALVVLVLLGVGALAGWLPARRAARTDPVAILRAE